MKVGDIDVWSVKDGRFISTLPPLADTTRDAIAREVAGTSVLLGASGEG